MKLSGILPELNVHFMYITMFDKRIIIPHASKYFIMSLQCYWNIEFTSEPILQTFIASTVMTHWRDDKANCMEAQIWKDLGLLSSKTKHGFHFL